MRLEETVLKVGLRLVAMPKECSVTWWGCMHALSKAHWYSRWVGGGGSWISTGSAPLCPNVGPHYHDKRPHCRLGLTERWQVQQWSKTSDWECKEEIVNHVSQAQLDLSRQPEDTKRKPLKEMKVLQWTELGLVQRGQLWEQARRSSVWASEGLHFLKGPIHSSTVWSLIVKGSSILILRTARGKKAWYLQYLHVFCGELFLISSAMERREGNPTGRKAISGGKEELIRRKRKKERNVLRLVSTVFLIKTNQEHKSREIY